MLSGQVHVEVSPLPRSRPAVHQRLDAREERRLQIAFVAPVVQVAPAQLDFQPRFCPVVRSFLREALEYGFSGVETGKRFGVATVLDL
jgi:hypothetical protein